MDMQLASKWCRALLLGWLVSTPVWADDTDIYLNNSALDTGITRIMLTLDFRSNVGSTICNDASSAACETIMGSRLYPEMDLYGLDGERGADGYPDQDQLDPLSLGNTIADTYWGGTKTNLYDVLRTVLRVVLNDVSQQAASNASIEGVEVGVMVAHEGTCKGAGPGQIPNLKASKPKGCSQGAYVLKGFTDISDPLTSAANLEDLFVKIAAIPEPGIQASWMKSAWNGHSFKIRDIYFEFFRYVTGGAVFNGFLGYDDYNSQENLGNLYETDNDVVFDLLLGLGDQALLSPDVSIMNSYNLGLSLMADDTDNISSATYESPLDPNDACSGLYMINSLFGTTGNSHGDTDTAIGGTAGSGGLGLSLSGGQDAKDAQLVGNMYNVDLGSSTYGAPDVPGVQNLTSYVISDKVRTNTNAIAAAGGTGQAYPLSDPQAALDTLSAIFNEILSVSTTFVAASVPTNVFNRAEVVDNLYFALFQAESEVRWNGNVKKLKIADLEVTDPNGVITTEQIIAQAPLTDPPKRAISNVDGRILTDALTFWTDTTGADVIAADPNAGEVSGKDGRTITRGGAGQQIPGFLPSSTLGADNFVTGARQVFTEDPSSANDLLDLDGSISDADLTALRPYLDPNDAITDGDPERELIKWIRGIDAYDEDGDTVYTDVRPWLMMDPMHSRPLVINYGAREGTSYTANNPDIRLFFGTNDGIFHGIKNTETNGNESGKETFAFIPLELLHWQKTLAANFAQIAEPHPYGMDGIAVSYVYDDDRDGNIEPTDGDYVWVFIGQRRGGDGLYAFDLTDPDDPELMWKVTSGTSGFEQLALTFSTPQAVTLDLGVAGGTPALIFAGGYNGGWSGNSRVGKDAGDANDTIGNAIYVVNAETGALIWKAVGPDGGAAPTNSDSLFYQALMTDSIPSNITVVDTDSNNVVDRAYVGDSGGNVWRVELTEAAYIASGSTVTDETNWYVTKLASFGGAGASDLRFFHGPDYVRTTTYDGVILTSGDRADPRETTVNNYAFAIKDTFQTTNSNAAAIKARTPLVIGDLTDITDLCITGAEAACTSADLSNGWKLELEASGEKGLSQPLTTNGVVLFTTYVPNDGSAGQQCTPSEGTGRVYVVNLSDGSVVFDLSAGGTTTKVDRYSEVGPGIPGDVIPYEDQVLIPGKGIGGKQIFNIPGRDLWRIYWREEDVDQL
ncbi:hypothetical protein FV139_16730 [Parahaliea maris]|uniref:PilY1 beta-propeller domain-containing protein n=1 Tax=Parahaliea maris TaxID=2716870 RepID=A0A5C8ZU88_9GAMM|nr:PilC/PilY family type IV pilus protein [Parahaliea maris]TXS91369.1 hypothetical protein FV139_16730 [Parahaliea maris]